jgi:hypothetical protein
MVGKGKLQSMQVSDKFDFNVPDEMWTRVLPLEYQRGVVRLSPGHKIFGR